MYRDPGNQIYKTVVVVWLTLSVASVILAAVTWVSLSHKLAAASDAAAIHNELDTILTALVDIESSQRGYTITGDDRFLEPFRRGEASLPPHFDRLVELSKSDSGMLRRVVELRAQSELCLNNSREIVAARKTQGGKVAAELVAQGEGRRYMDAMREKVEVIREMPSSLITDKGAAARAQLLRASLTSLVAGILGIGAGIFAVWLSRIMLRQQSRERELVEARLEAERSSQEKTAFLANMSHEIRTPMNAILGFAELLQAELREPRHSHYLQSIRSSAGSLLQLINDILDMSKIEAGVLELRLEPTDPREICDFLHTVFAEPAARNNVKLECKVAEDLPRALLLDRVRLRQILVNLVGNAVKFTDRGTISVNIHWQPQEVSSKITLLIDVEDTGVGIPRDKLQAIFKPFVQAGAHQEKEKAGTGLGLSIVKRLTEIMHGTVSAASVLGQGSAFSLRFTDVAISSRLALGEKLETGRAVDFNDLNPATILVVDDNEANCHLVAGMFDQSHHRLHFGTNGREAIEKAREVRPDVILMDIRMPGMDGRQALEAIRRISGLELVPIVAVTASTLFTDDPGSAQRFSGYVRKPFTRADLFDELAEFLPKRSPAVAGTAAVTTTESASSTTPQVINATSAARSHSGPVAAGLIDTLRQLETTDWPGIRDTVAINETKAFAARLQSLARQWDCPALEQYSQVLTQHALNYSIPELEKHLTEFSTFIARLQAGAPP